MNRKEFEAALIRAKAVKLCLIYDQLDHHFEHNPAARPCVKQAERIVAEAIEKARKP